MGDEKKKQKKEQSISLSNENDELKIMLEEITDQDVLFGRGGKGNGHRGNIAFRKKALDLRVKYGSASKVEKRRIAEGLVSWVKKQNGRFLIQDREVKRHWYIVTDERKVHSKASQALREAKTMEERQKD